MNKCIQIERGLCVALGMLLLVACGGTAVAPAPAPVPTVSGHCVGDINGDGVVSLDEATKVTIAKTNGAPASDAAVVAADVDGDGTISDVEFYEVIQNEAVGTCRYTK